MIRELFKKESSPLDLYSLASEGGSAENIRRALAPILGKEIEYLLTQIGSAKPDLGTYSFLAGQIKMVHKLMVSLRLTIEEGREAADRLRKEGIG